MRIEVSVATDGVSDELAADDAKSLLDKMPRPKPGRIVEATDVRDDPPRIVRASIAGHEATILVKRCGSMAEASTLCKLSGAYMRHGPGITEIKLDHGQRHSVLVPATHDGSSETDSTVDRGDNDTNENP